MPTIGARIAALREKNRYTQELLAQNIGVSTNTVARWESGIRNPSDKKKKLLADFFEVPISYLIDDLREGQESQIIDLGTEPQVLSSTTTYHRLPDKPVTQDDVVWVPVVSNKVIDACCGNGSVYFNDDIGWEAEGHFPVPSMDVMGYTWQGAKFIIMTATGDSMEPNIYSGDKVLFATHVSVGVGDIVVFSLDSKLYIRGIARVKNNHFTLRAFRHNDYPDLEVDPDTYDFCIIGKALKVVSSRGIPSMI